MIDEQRVLTAERDDLPAIVGELARLSALALARLVTPCVIPTREPEPDRLLTAAVGELLKIAPEQVRRTAALKPYRKRLSPRKFRYSRAGLLRFMRRAS